MRLFLIPMLLALPLALGAQDTLPRRHRVVDNVLELGQGGMAALEVDRSYRYVGGQRFILRGVADAEQHLFVDADVTGRIKRSWWIQIESFLPGRGLYYDYSMDSLRRIGGREWRASVRRFSSPPAAGSDRERATELLSRAGLHYALPAVRLRLVFLTAPDMRAELMLVYTEPAAGDGDPTPAEAEALLARALAGLRFRDVAGR